MNRLVKFWSLTRREKMFLCEASILLLLTNALVTAIAFKHIDWFLRSRWKDAVQDAVEREQEITHVQRSISHAANVLSRKSLCLSRSIVEFIMLRRRGIPAVMFAGVRLSGRSSLEAHAWVKTGLRVSEASSENFGFTTVIKIGSGAIDR